MICGLELSSIVRQSMWREDVDKIALIMEGVHSSRAVTSILDLVHSLCIILSWLLE